MPRFCAVVGCGSRGGRDQVRFFRFPPSSGRTCKNSKPNELILLRRQKWIQALRREGLTETILSNQRICSKHFITGKPSDLSDRNHPDWIPSLNMGHGSKTLQSASDSRISRHKRAKKRSIPNQMSLVVPEPHELHETPQSPADEAISLETHTEPSRSSVSTIIYSERVDYQTELQFAYEKIYNLEDKLNEFIIDLNQFRNDEEMCKFYTGLTFKTLSEVHDEIKPLLPSNTVLTTSQQLVLCLMKLRLNPFFKDLGYRFKINRRTASRIFYHVVYVLYCSFKWLIKWPTREMITFNSPPCFDSFKNVVCILDCFEVFSQVPSAKEAATQHYSHYKSHCTVKFLISITPMGTVSFISEGFGGRCSDKHVTLNSGILGKLNPGDVVIADRGFLISDDVNMCMARLETPSFVKGRNHLQPLEVEQSRSLSNVRIHVERVIGTIKNKYTMMQGKLPINLIQRKNNGVPVIDQIATVCCSLCNLCPSVIPQ